LREFLQQLTFTLYNVNKITNDCYIHFYLQHEATATKKQQKQNMHKTTRPKP